MKFHFFGSLVGDKEVYNLIFNCLKQLGHEPVTYHVLNRKVEDIDKETPDESAAYVRKMKRWIQRADFIVFEVTLEEVSIGFEMMLAFGKGKPVLVLYQQNIGKIPSTLLGIQDERFFISPYKKDLPGDLKETLKLALGEIRNQINTRFTLLLPPEIISYLDKLALDKSIPRSVFIRNLIEREMKKK